VRACVRVCSGQLRYPAVNNSAEIDISPCKHWRQPGILCVMPDRRPNQPCNSRRTTAQISARLKVADWLAVHAAAQQQGVTVATFVRDVVLAGIPRDSSLYSRIEDNVAELTTGNRKIAGHSVTAATSRQNGWLTE
jgi:hypothetical protein